MFQVRTRARFGAGFKGILKFLWRNLFWCLLKKLEQSLSRTHTAYPIA